MKNKNLDSIKRHTAIKDLKKSAIKESKFLKVDAITSHNFSRTTNKNLITSPKLEVVVTLNGNSKPKQIKRSFFRNFYVQRKVPIFAAVAALFLAFGAGMWAAVVTPKTAAVDQEELQQQINPPVSLGSVAAAQGPVTNDVLFNTPIEYLKSYLDAVNEPLVIEHRKNLLEQYLKDMHSPFAEAAETIAQQPHWELILAIAFAESTLGKNCADKNCSNIGVKPGAPSWRQYASYRAWIVDFNRLLDKRYKDKTLEQMCGVYVQPCNPNWLLATKQVLDELKDRGIE